VAVDIPARARVPVLDVPVLVQEAEGNFMSFPISIDRIKSAFTGRTNGRPKPGLYHFRMEKLDEKARIHLRIDTDGAGVLIVNANRLMHLNSTAAWIAYDFLNHIPSDTTISALINEFRTKKQVITPDYELIVHQLEELIRPDGACAIHELELETRLPFSTKPSAPYRMDLALTYRCNNDCSHCYNARQRDFHEMTTQEWKSVIDKVWDLAIPHIVFTGGEPTLREDLVELIQYAEKKGLVTGLNTNGRRLANTIYLQSLVGAGLDHVQITFESHVPEIHDLMVHSPGAWLQTQKGIENAVGSDLYLMTNTTMLQANSSSIRETLTYLVELKVPTIGLNSLIYSGRGADVGSGLREDQLPALLEMAKEITGKAGQRLIWYTPTEYCHFDPVNFDLGIKGCSAASYNMCIEPNGDVLPCQSYYSSLGNILQDEWQTIWNHPLAISLRERKDIPEKCNQCSLLVECGGGCPLHRVNTIQEQTP
jgi:radical SAM protein with 4Fe4S-binding SPASM domain